MRGALLDFYKKHQRQTRWDDIRKAYSHRPIVDIPISIRIDSIDHISGVFVKIFSYLIGTLGLVTLFVGLLLIRTHGWQAVGLALLGFVCFLVGALILNQNAPYESARKVAKLVAADQERESSSHARLASTNAPLPRCSKEPPVNAETYYV